MIIRDQCFPAVYISLSEALFDCIDLKNPTFVKIALNLKIYDPAYFSDYFHIFTIKYKHYHLSDYLFLFPDPNKKAPEGAFLFLVKPSHDQIIHR